MGIVWLIAAFVISSALGQVLLKVGVTRMPTYEHQPALSTQLMDVMTNICVLSGLGMWVITTLAYIWMLKKIELSYAYSFSSLNYLIIPVIGFLFFQETISPLRLVGLTLIFIGVLLTGFASHRV